MINLTECADSCRNVTNPCFEFDIESSNVENLRIPGTFLRQWMIVCFLPDEGGPMTMIIFGWLEVFVKSFSRERSLFGWVYSIYGNLGFGGEFEGFLGFSGVKSGF